jgi:putative flippase GtrA
MTGWRASLAQVLRFGTVGAAATAVHYAVALPASLLASAHLANTAGYVTAVAVSYIGHHRFTFRVPAERRDHGVRFRRHVVASLSAFLASQALLSGLQGLALPAPLPLLAAVALIPAITFVLGRIWVFA